VARQRTRLGLAQRQTQRLGLSQGVLTALGVLRMSADELADALLREAEVNPFLRPGLPPPAPPSRPLPAAGGAGADPGTDPGDGSDRIAAAGPDWQQDLIQQITLRSLPAGIAALAVALVGELDERGWLDTPLEAIAADWGQDPASLAAALAVVQGCEPAGIGARDLTECLTLQLVAQGLAADVARATLAELPRFARRDWPGIARALGISQAEARRRGARLAGLSPRPVADRDGAAAPVMALRPDLELIRHPDGRTSVAPARGHVPRPGLDAALARQARAQGFGPDLLARAQAMIAAVERRADTLVRIGTWLVSRQAAALAPPQPPGSIPGAGPGSPPLAATDRLHGPAALVGARQVDCAADLGLHPATVSRAVAGKALLVDGRLWPLARLFTPPAPGRDAGAAAAPGAAAVAHRIAALIAAEDPRRPLSDTALQRMLTLEGVDMARRTVAKYRDGLRIPPAPRRRRRD